MARRPVTAAPVPRVYDDLLAALLSGGPGQDVDSAGPASRPPWSCMPGVSVPAGRGSAGSVLGSGATVAGAGQSPRR
jgi:hypothetical protein